MPRRPSPHRSPHLRRNGLLLLAAAAIVAAPLVLPVAERTAQPFAGADERAAAAALALRPDYRPWFAPLWQPPGPEIESLLFALQAALGAGLAGYYLGLRRGRRQRTAEDGGSGAGSAPTPAFPRRAGEGGNGHANG